MPDSSSAVCLAEYNGCSTTCQKSNWEEQKLCDYSDKSDYRSCCRHYLDWDGGLCRSLRAQRVALKEK